MKRRKPRATMENVLFPRDESIGFRGYGNQPLRVAKGLRGSKFGPASRGRRFTKAEIEAYEKSR